ERQLDENWQKSTQAIGIRMVFETAQWPEHMKAARAGKLQMWGLGSTLGADAQAALAYMYGPSVGSRNLARFRSDAFDAIFRRMLVLPDGPERAGLFREAAKIITAYMPYKTHVHRIYNDLTQPWVSGWREAPFRRESWMYAEVDGERRATERR
ncbi:MAG TPA: bicyclomycin resistance protein, partial [Burkholderiaceae bacterium]|nr:bicyclomycin resistance protein [Burkholderiaceae bacterium]